MNINWIKLDINILNDEKIKVIRTYPEGDSLFVLWIGLLCLAMRSRRPGTIELADGIPFSKSDLAGIFSMEHKTIELGLGLFEKYQMISVHNGSSIQIINLAKHQDLDKIETIRMQARDRKRKQRERNQLLPEPCHAVTQSHASVTHESRSCHATDKIRLDKIRLEEDIVVKRKKPALSRPAITFLFDKRAWENITEEDKAGWQEAYPACDVSVELRSMREWLLANPEKRKVNYRSFIVKWLSRAQQSGGTRKGNSDVRTNTYKQSPNTVSESIRSELERVEAAYEHSKAAALRNTT